MPTVRLYVVPFMRFAAVGFDICRPHHLMVWTSQFSLSEFGSENSTPGWKTETNLSLKKSTATLALPGLAAAES
jgi:hypothetical protein